MMQTDEQDNLDAIISSGEQLFSLAKELDMVGLEKELPEYSQQIEQYFLGVDKENLTSADVESLKRVMSTHEKIVTIISEKKETTSKNIKQLHMGKKMQNAYPKTAL